MGGKLAVFTLAFVLSSFGLKAQDDFSVSFDNYTYTGSNGCSDFGACDRNFSTVTDRSGLQSSGWQFDGNSWMVGFTPGQLQTLSPSFTDQFNSIQSSIQQAVQNLNSQEVVHGALELGANGLEIAEQLGYAVDPYAMFALKGLAMGTTPGLEVGTTYPPSPPIFDPALDSPISAQSGSANPSVIPGASGPFTTVDPGSVTIVDPPFTGDPSTIIDLNSNSDSSSIIDESEAQQMLLNAKRSHDSLISQQQQFQNQASQYQIQSQQVLNQSSTIFQSAFDRAFSNELGNISGYRSQGSSASTTENGWQSLASALNGLSRASHSTQPFKGSSALAAQAKVAGPQGCTRGSPEEIAACQMSLALVRYGLVPAAPGQSWMLNTPATQSPTPIGGLGPTGVKCQTDAKGRTLCTGTLPSWMH